MSKAPFYLYFPYLLLISNGKNLALLICHTPYQRQANFSKFYRRCHFFMSKAPFYLYFPYLLLISNGKNLALLICHTPYQRQDHIVFYKSL